MEYYISSTKHIICKYVRTCKNVFVLYIFIGHGLIGTDEDEDERWSGNKHIWWIL